MYSKEYIEELVKDLKRNKSIIEDKNMCIKSLNKINFEMKCKLSDEKLKVESRQKEIEYLTQKNKILETKIKNLTIRENFITLLLPLRPNYTYIRSIMGNSSKTTEKHREKNTSSELNEARGCLSSSRRQIVTKSV